MEPANLLAQARRLGAEGLCLAAAPQCDTLRLGLAPLQRLDCRVALRPRLGQSSLVGIPGARHLLLHGVQATERVVLRDTHGARLVLCLPLFSTGTLQLRSLRITLRHHARHLAAHLSQLRAELRRGKSLSLERTARLLKLAVEHDDCTMLGRRRCLWFGYGRHRGRS